MKDKVELVQERLNRAERALDDFKDKVHRLRDLVAGNPRALESKGTADDQSTYDVKRANVVRRPEIFVQDIEEGRSNKLLHTIRTLAQQTTFRFPEIEFEDLDKEEAVLHSEYLRQRLGAPPLGCDAVNHMKRCLYDFMTGGLGWNWIGMQGGKPILRSVDTLECKWDQSAATIGESRWWSTSMSASFETWASMFGQAKMEKYLKHKKPDPDTPVDLEYYYDLDGSEGTYMVLFKTGENEVDMTPVLKRANPCFWDYGGQRVPFLPAECMFFMEIPSVRLPISLTEQMLPSQIALWRVERTIRDIVDCPAFYEVEEDSIDQKEMKKFLEGQTGAFLTRKKGSQPIIQNPALAVPDTLMAWQGLHSQEITGQGGANPYASGAPVEGTEYAAEVNAIQGAAGLMSGTIAKENADFWIRTLRKFLAKGKIDDEWPLVVRYEDEELIFDESDPVNMYLKPDTRLSIRESSMQYQDEKTKVLMARQDVEVALQMADRSPQAPIEAYENYLRARGERNIEKFLAPPAAPMMPQEQQMAPVTAPQ